MIKRTANKIDHTIYKEHPKSPTHVGTYENQVCINGKIRRYITYIPSDALAACAGIFIIPKSGISAEDMLENSDWVTLAETDERKEKFIIHILESDGKWNIENPQEDLDYVHAVYTSARLRDRCIIHESKCYLAGYGDGGAIAQLSAVDCPTIYAGVVSVGAPEISALYIEEKGNEPCLDLNGYEDPNWTYGYRKKDFFVPSWIISDETLEKTGNSSLASYWRCSGELCETPHMLRPDTMEYIREKPAKWTVNQDTRAFRLWVSCILNADIEYGSNINRRLWTEFLYGVRRWMAEPGGDLRLTEDPVTDLDMEYHFEDIDGWMREYYVYIPRAVRENPKKAVPLVFALHGYTCSGETYAGNSGWHRVAEENGFIAVFPSAVHGHLRFTRHNIEMILDNETELPAWNVFDEVSPAPDEIRFFEAMLDRISRSYSVDKSRIFATGHSMGSLMVQLLGMARPELFAAIAPCSGVMFANADKIFPQKEEVKNRKQIKLPIWMFGGENEEWIMDAVPLCTNETGQTIHMWWDLNKRTSDKPVDFEAYRTDNGRWKDYVFEEEGEAPIRYTWVEEMPHATMPEMSYRIWEEFFAGF